MSRVEKNLSHDDFEALAEQLQGLSSADVIWVLNRLSLRRRAIVYRLLDKTVALNVFERLTPSYQAELIEALQEDKVTELFAGLRADDRVWVLDELPAKVAAKLLAELPEEERAHTDALLGYPEHSVGRRTSPRVVTARPDFTVAETMQRIKEQLETAETVYFVPVIDSGRKVRGAVTLRQLVGAEPETLVSDLMQPPPLIAHVADSAEEVARKSAKNEAIAACVVDDESRLVGVFTLDDAARILEREESEDSARQGGTEPLRRPYLSTRITQMVRSRITWLLVLAVGATLTVQVLSVFEETLESVTVLALFVPLLIGIGGNTGNQAATTVTRAVALHYVTPRDIGKVFFRELRVGFLLGLLLGALGFAITGFVFEFRVGLVIGLTLLSVCCVAASIGGIMPLVARSLKVDPAVFSNPFISTFVDATGLIIYFVIARAVLQI